MVSCCCCAVGVWRRSVSMAVWAAWRSLMSASPGRSKCLAGASPRKWSGRWGRRRGNCLRTEQPSPAPLSFRPSWDLPPSSPCSSTSASCSRGCPSEEVRGGGSKCTLSVCDLLVLWSHVPSIHSTPPSLSSPLSPVHSSTMMWADQLSAIFEIRGCCS